MRPPGQLHLFAPRPRAAVFLGRREPTRAERLAALREIIPVAVVREPVGPLLSCAACGAPSVAGRSYCAECVRWVYVAR